MDALEDPLPLVVPDHVGFRVRHLALEGGRLRLGDADVLQLLEHLVPRVDGELALGAVVVRGAPVLALRAQRAVADLERPKRIKRNFSWIALYTGMV